jgi:segregation and condensation protein B
MASLEEVKVPMASSLQQVVGALLFGADSPLSVEDIRACLKGVAEADGGASETVKLFAEASPREVSDAVEGISKELARLGLGIEVTGLNGGFRFQTQPCCGRWVRNLLKIDRPNNLSRPALETLAIIAYRQPIAKSEIESIRGVMVDHIVKALMELHLIRIVGRSELPGRPFLYGTTATFLNHFGLNNLKELNELDPTLQRSKSAERKAAHRRERKEKKDETPGESAAVNDVVAEMRGGGGQDAENAEPVFEDGDGNAGGGQG